ncbi:hypothetical protein BJY01DRAFT_254641 [Aspergillus pseudoustus]|uniref:AAA+ ATPase domain-containing protein n=1 Tax=Aspergillus pseudoustus TaxID=1810923 RepID=A0ABR4IRM6_9EURO
MASDQTSDAQFTEGSNSEFSPTNEVPQLDMSDVDVELEAVQSKKTEDDDVPYDGEGMGGDEAIKPPVARIPEVTRTNFVGFWYRLAEDDIYAIDLWYGGSTDAPLNAFEGLVSEKGYDPVASFLRTRKAPSDNDSLLKMRINSPAIATALREIDPSIPTDAVPLRFSRPFTALVEKYALFKEYMIGLQKKTAMLSVEPDHVGEIEPDHKETLDHLACYAKLMETDILPLYDAFRSSEPDTKIHFLELDLLFRDDEDLYYPASGDQYSEDQVQHQHLWRLVPRIGFRFKGETGFTGSAFTGARLSCYRLDYDGLSYAPVTEEIEFPEFAGLRDVTSLPIYPLRFAPNAGRILEESRKSGLRFKEAIDEKQMLYQGWALRYREDGRLDRAFVSSNVVVDFAETFKSLPAWMPPSAATWPNDEGWVDNRSGDSIRRASEPGELIKEVTACWTFDARYSPIKETETYLKKQGFFLNCARHYEKGIITQQQKEQKELVDDDIILLPRRLFAYSLQDRMFVMLSTANIRRLDQIDDPFNDLVISPSHKRTIWSLVHSHFDKKQMEHSHGFYDASQDIIHSKGRGLIILLHGAPGVGKTSTAEAVAQKWKKPLLAITCGDLGLEAAEVERSLKEIFRLAQLWDCVLLLDEADVFLSQRLPSDLQRNALVSVFLRVLEYYSGILFLTTNRVGNMDEAFKSRIHISLYYPQLDLSKTKKIWKMNLGRLESIEEGRHKATGQPKLTIAFDDIMRFAVDHFEQASRTEKVWNGRQIRNAFLTAAAIARYEKQHPRDKQQSRHTFDIRPEHFKTVADASSGFDDYLREAKGKSDSQLAQYSGTRADHFSPSTQPQPTLAGPEMDNTYAHAPLEHQNLGYYQRSYSEQSRVPASRPAQLSAHSSYDSPGRRHHNISYQAGYGGTPDPYNERLETPHDSFAESRSSLEESRYSARYGSSEDLHVPSRSRTPHPQSRPQWDPRKETSSPLPYRGGIPAQQADRLDDSDEEDFKCPEP